MPLKASPAHKATVAHAEMIVAPAAALPVPQVLVVVIVAAHKAAVVVATVAVPQLLHLPKHKPLLFKLTPSYRT